MRKAITFIAASLLVASAFGAGEVYRWRGADGVWHYSDQPRAGAELVRAGTPTQPPQADQAAAAAATGEPSMAPADAPPAQTTDSLPVSEDVAAEVRAAAAAAKSEQCKRAEDQYTRAIQARRITRTDADGKLSYLNSAEIDAARLQARANRDLACNPNGA